MSVKLGIVVPYRDRAEHLAVFVPHLRNFFARQPDFSVRVLISEQVQGRSFNRGFMNNVGFEVLAPEIDYVCFHDVDLLPEVADYRGSHWPAMLISRGLHPSLAPAVIRQLFSAVVMMNKTQFSDANGFSNNYWGWGFEDVDLRERLLRVGCRIDHREGIFTRLPHTDLGSFSDGRPTPDHVTNKARYVSLWFDQTPEGFVRKQQPGDFWLKDGLSKLGRIRTGLSRRQLETSDGVVVEHIVAEPLHWQREDEC